jgi:ABC-type transport system involved in cytochrome bd biosynthesis fused ATPase/permease subunit
MVMYRGSVNDFINYLQRRNPMIDALRPFLSRILAPAITALLGILAVKFGLDFGADAAGHLTEYAVVIVVAVMQLANGLIHRSIDKKVNPADAASSQIAAIAKAESEKGIP